MKYNRLRSGLLAAAITSLVATGWAQEDTDQDRDESADKTQTAHWAEHQLRVLERLSITGTAGPQIDAIPGAAHNVDAEALDEYSYNDVHRVLRRVPGVNLHEEGGYGLFPHIGLRGTRLQRSSRITLMEDGVLTAPAAYSASSAYYFPLVGRMHRVEVRKGSSAIQYGPYTTGGAINLVSTPIPESFSAHARVMMGGDGGRRAHVNAGDQGDHFGWLVEGYHTASDGFRRLDRVPESTGPNAPVPDTGFDIDNYLARLRWRTGGEAAMVQSFELKLGRDERTINDTYLGLTPHDYAADPLRRYRGSQLDQVNTSHEQVQLTHFIALRDDIDLTTVVYNRDFARNWYKLHGVQNEPGGSFVGISSVLDNPASFAGALEWIRGESVDGLLGNVRANNREYYARGVESRLTWQFSGGAVDHELVAGLRYHRDEEDRWQWQDSYRMVDGTMVLVRPADQAGAESGAESGIPGSTTNRVTDARAVALSLHDTMRFGDWTLSPGVRFEDIAYTRRDYPAGDDPRRDQVIGRRSGDTSVALPGAGATWQPAAGVTLLAGLHRGFAPTGPGSDEETSWNFETGVRYRDGGLSAGLIGFHTRYDNLVGVCTLASGGDCEVGDEFDGGRVDVTGLEAELAWDVGAAAEWPVALPVSLAWTWTESEFKNSFDSNFGEWGEVVAGDELPQIPAHQINLGIGLEYDPVAFHLNVNRVSATRAVAGSGAIPADQRIDARTLIDLSAEYQVHPHARLFASIENLTDKRYLSNRRPSGVRPGMPRTAWLGVKLDL